MELMDLRRRMFLSIFGGDDDMDNWELIAEATLQEDARTFACETVPLKKIWVFCQTCSPADVTSDYKNAQWGALTASANNLYDFLDSVVRKSTWPRPVIYYADVTSGVRRQAVTFFDGENWSNTQPYDSGKAYQVCAPQNHRFSFFNFSLPADEMTGFTIQMASVSDLLAAGSKMKIYGVRA